MQGFEFHAATSSEYQDVSRLANALPDELGGHALHVPVAGHESVQPFRIGADELGILVVG